MKVLPTKMLARSLGVVCAFGFLTVAFGDDWLMFRKDSARAGASTEKVGLPLKSLWTWKGSGTAQGSVSTAVLRKGELFFVGTTKNEKNKGGQRTLYCLDSKTGKTKWQQPLAASQIHPLLPEDIGPVVSDSGVVYVFDRGSAKTEDCSAAVDTVANAQGEFYVLRAFSADKGKQLGILSVPIRESLSRLFLRDGHEDEKDFFLAPNAKPDC